MLQAFLLCVPLIAFRPVLSFGITSHLGFTTWSPRPYVSTVSPLRATREIPSWDSVKEPPDTGGRRYGPNWSFDENLNAKQTDGVTGAFVWAIGNQTYTHPELRDDFPVGKWLKSRPNLGICMSGGGLRAATCALGWYRALNHLGYLQKARYIGANSGSTWVTMPLFAQQLLKKKEFLKDEPNLYENILGKYVKPEDISMDKDELGLMGDALQKSNVLNYTPSTDADKRYNDWCDSIEKNYVAPFMSWKDASWRNDFWLDLSNAYLWNKGSKILDDNTMPFPIFASTCYEEKDPNALYPMELTPLYAGIPVDPRSLVKKARFGGGFVQGVGLNARSVASDDKEKSPVQVNAASLFSKEFVNPSPVVKIFELTGASSNFGAETLAKIKFRIKWLMPVIAKLVSWFLPDAAGSDVGGFTTPGTYYFWSPTTGGDPVKLELVDGGMFDNFGILGLLRRKCSTIIACDASGSDVLATEEKDWGKTFTEVAALFGRFEPGSFPPAWMLKSGYKDEVNPRSQVFASKEWDSLMDEMKLKRQQGKPLVVRRNLTIIPNPKAGVFEGGQVDITFCFNSVIDEFENGWKKNNGNKSLTFAKGFPYISTFKCDYSMDDVNKLAHLCSFQLVDGLEKVGFDISAVAK